MKADVISVQIILPYVGFEVSKAEKMAVLLLSVATSCAIVGSYRHFGGTCCLRLQPWNPHGVTLQEINTVIFLHVSHRKSFLCSIYINSIFVINKEIHNCVFWVFFGNTVKNSVYGTRTFIVVFRKVRYWTLPAVIGVCSPYSYSSSSR
jgi:hypothetical protein